MKKVVDEPDFLNMQSVVSVLHVYSSLNHTYRCLTQEYVLVLVFTFLLPYNVLKEKVTNRHKVSESLQTHTSMAVIHVKK